MGHGRGEGEGRILENYELWIVTWEAGQIEESCEFWVGRDDGLAARIEL